MRNKPGSILRRAFSSGGLWLLLSFFVPAPGTAAERTPPPADPIEVNKQTRQATQNLDRDVNAGGRNLQRLARQTRNLENEAKRAKSLADKALKAAEEAFDAATKCNKARFEQLSKQARDLAGQAQQAKDKADKMHDDLNREAKETMDRVNQRFSDIQNAISEGFKGATQAGFADNSVAVGNLRDAQQMLNNEMARQNSEGTKEKKYEDEGSLHKLNRAKNEFDNQLKKIREGNDPGEALKKVEQLLIDGAALLEKNCPPKVGALPQKPVDFFVALDNQPQVNVCIPAGKDVHTELIAMGLGNAQVLATTPTGTVARAPGDAKTVEKIAKEKGIDLCFVESDFCTIMTPLTPFRGHDHQAHEQSGRGPHEHDAPDPGPDWGITPPEIVVRLE